MMMERKFCEYCGSKLAKRGHKRCNCDELREENHLYDFLLVEHKDEFMLSYSEEKGMLEYAEHRLG